MVKTVDVILQLAWTDEVALLAAQALKFLLAEEHITPATLFLLSSAAAAITGQDITICGGASLPA